MKSGKKTPSIQGMRPPAGLAHTPVRSGSKKELINRFRDVNEDEIFGKPEELESFEDDFKTLKLGGPQNLETIKLNSKSIGKYQELEEEDFDDDMEFDGNKFEKLKYEPRPDDIKISPGTVSTSSPRRRKSLSEYSEETNDTDVTSQFNDDDFEDVDNIFGDEESGIYSSGSKNYGNQSRLNEQLMNKQRKLQNDAEIEEQELKKKYNRLQNQSEINTLKLKDLNNDIDDQGRTINFEYTRDDFENFEDGFDLDAGKLKSFKKKHSMPNFNSHKLKDMKKFKSSNNLSLNKNPKFNNKVFSRLNRIPSLQQLNESDQPQHQQQHQQLPRNNDKQALHEAMAQNQSLSMNKHKLLQKYKEFDKQQRQTNEQIKTMKKSISEPANRHNKKIGLVRYLNDIPNAPNDKMRFNKDLKKWEGNDHELMKFNNNIKKPSLIKMNDFKPESNESNMIFDEKNLRWINKQGDNDESDIFKDVPDLPPPRGVSLFTQRSISTANEFEEEEEEFNIPPKFIDRFLKEELKIAKKTEYWFNNHETYDLSSDFNYDHYWEIRKLVMDNE